MGLLLALVLVAPPPCETPTCQLEQLLGQVEQTARTRAAVEAPTEFTMTWVHFEFAWAFAAVGAAERSAALAAAAKDSLGAREDALNTFFVQAYLARIAEAGRGEGVGGPLAPSTPR